MVLLYGTSSREMAWRSLEERWDLIVVGGGITGAGILREAVRTGLRVLLLEQNDFASGTSSRSSKMVHGGLRYLNNLQFRLTWQAVHERERLLREGPGLIEPLPFLYPTYTDDKLPAWLMAFGLRLYGWIGGRWRIHEALDRDELLMMAPGLSSDRLTGGFRFCDAQTDDARLVLRVLREGVATGRAVALNYARVEGLLYGEDGLVNGVIVCDRETGRTHRARADAVINATGAWADHLRGQVGAEPHIRPLRGSHLVFPHQRFPVFQAVTFPHPEDGRPVFAFPWEGVTLFGTTDLDHDQSMDREPSITPEEVTYLLRAAEAHFPSLELKEKDVLASFSGVRPVISHRKDVAPSKESREHVLWNERGLLTVTGGKLTTFRCIALDALRALRKRLRRPVAVDDHMGALDPLPQIEEPPPGLTMSEALRLVARYGPEILDFARRLPDRERTRLGGLPIHRMELRWAARQESVLHLDDLLLRRVRLGLLAPCGGRRFLLEIRQLVQGELGWSDAQWEQEVADYLARWQAHYSLPEIAHPDTEHLPEGAFSAPTSFRISM